MRIYVSGPLACCWLFSALLSAAQVTGTVVDPSGAPIPGAQVSIIGRVGVEAQTAASSSGAFELEIVETAGAKLVVTAPGFSTRTLPLESEVAVPRFVGAKPPLILGLRPLLVRFGVRAADGRDQSRYGEG